MFLFRPALFKPNSYRLSKKLIILSLLAGLLFLAFNFHSKQLQPITMTDAEGYYLYLPAIFVHGGFEKLQARSSGRYDYFPGTEKTATRYTYGVAFLQAPFFLIAHGLATILGYAQDGYSSVYQCLFIVGGLFYLVVGLWLLFLSLRIHFSWWVSFFTCLLTWGGTNLYYYSVGELGMSHVYSFFLFAALLYYLPTVYHRSGWKDFLLASLILGFITLIRPTNIIVALLVLGYGINTFSDFGSRFQFIKIHFFKFLLFPGMFLLIMLPQIWYWYYLSGDYFLYSYGNQGFSNWNRPQIGNVLFSVQNGLFVYSPLVLLSVGGLTWLAIEKKLEGGIRLIVFLLATYIFASWWAWWFGGAFGARSYVEYYAMLALPLGFMLTKVGTMLQQQPTLGKLTIGVLAVAVYYNIKLTYQYDPPWDGPSWTWATYFEELRQLFSF